MEDEKIIELYFLREERAIRETQDKYQSMLLATAKNVLGSTEAAREIVNDVLLKTWNSIPPAKPRFFSVWLRKVTRRMAIDAFRRETRKKRGWSVYAETLDEIAELASGDDGPEDLLDAKELAALVSAWLKDQPEKLRQIFLLRYFDSADLKTIAGKTGNSETNVKVILYRLRRDLKDYLIKEGYPL